MRRFKMKVELMESNEIDMTIAEELLEGQEMENVILDDANQS